MNKRIFFFLGSLKLGGTEVVASRIAEKLSEEGYEVYFVLLKSNVEIPVSEECQIISLQTEKKKNRLLKIFWAYYHLYKIYFKLKPAKIISFSSGLNILLLISFLPNQVLTVDTNLFFVKSKLYRRRILKGIGFFPNVCKVIIPSNELRLRFKDYLNANSFKKLVTIYNPLPLLNSKFEVPPLISENKKKYFISVGRLNNHKGFKQLIRCFSQAKFKEDINLYILGAGPAKDELEEEIKSLELESRVKLLGFQKNPNGYIQHAEALILNSSFESFGNVLVEALALGVPVISNDCDFGPREIIFHKVNGLLYQKEKDENLITVLEEYINDKSLRLELKRNSSYKLERFKTDKIVEEWIRQILE